MSLVGVQFNDVGKIYYFNDNGFYLKKKLTVIVETERGLQFGRVVSFSDDVSAKHVYKNVIRISTKKDYLMHLNNLKDAKLALSKCHELISKEKLNMYLIDANYTFDRDQLVFRYTSDDRVDFRNLAKKMGSLYKTRIEFRQIGIRDKAKEVGGFGPCGRILCCTSFLNDFASVSINMAKNQLLSLNPNKINGSCGRLLCCLKYEDDNYDIYRKGMPMVGQYMKTSTGSGKVVSINLFKRSYMVYSEDNGLVEEFVDDCKTKTA